MIKNIAIDFPEDFTPPEKFNQIVCSPCPFFACETYDPYEWCCLIDYLNSKENDWRKESDDCPVKKYFN